MSCDNIIVAIVNDGGKCKILLKRGDTLSWDYKFYTLVEIYDTNFTYKPPIGKTIDDVFVDIINPLYEIEFIPKHLPNQEKKIGSVLFECSYAFLLKVENSYYRYYKKLIEYEIVYEQENLDFIDEL